MQQELEYYESEERSLIFQINAQFTQPFCIYLSPSSTLAELYEKMEYNLFPEMTDRKTIVSYHSNPMLEQKEKRKIHYIVVMNFALNKTLTIPKNKRTTLRQFIKGNDIYFENCSQFPAFQTVYKIFVIDDELNKELQEYIYQNSMGAVIYRQVIKMTQCFTLTTHKETGSLLQT
jgi:hypothetical protein